MIIGLALIAADSDVVEEEGVTTVEHGDTILGPRPDFSPTSTVISILIALGLGTALALLLIKFNVLKLWKLWFFLAIFIALTIAFGVIMPSITALILAFLLTAWKVFKPDAFVQNLTELFVYAGIALLFVPLLNITTGIIILLLIALYDAYAVWKSKHMITLAKFQTEAGTFENCLLAAETTPLEPDELSLKAYAPGIGLVLDDAVRLIDYGHGECDVGDEEEEEEE